MAFYICNIKKELDHSNEEKKRLELLMLAKSKENYQTHYLNSEKKSTKNFNDSNYYNEDPHHIENKGIFLLLFTKCFI